MYFIKKSLSAACTFVVLMAFVGCGASVSGTESAGNFPAGSGSAFENSSGSESESFAPSMGDSSSKSSSVVADGAAMGYPLILPEIVEECPDLEGFAAQSKDRFFSQRDGIVVSPYYSVTISGTEIPVYTTPANNGQMHNIAMADFKAESFPLTVSVRTNRAFINAEVLPQYYWVSCIVKEDTILFSVSDYGYYTLLFDGGYENALTIAVREYEEISVLEISGFGI